MNTTALVNSENIQGNIGSCSVKVATAKTGFWTQETVQTNSCTGEIISTHEYVDGGVIAISILLVLLGIFLVGMVAAFFRI